MPANLTQQYRKAEAAYRRAGTLQEELQCLEWMLRELPKHKGTDKLQADLKQKISRARSSLAQPKRGKSVRDPRIPRQGAGRVVLLGGPNAGKSQFVANMTRASTEVAPWPFATREPSPAMMPVEDVLVQLIDTPSVTADVLDPLLLNLLRGADVALLIADVSSDEGIEALLDVWRRCSQSKTRLGRESQLDENDVGVSYTATILALNKTDVAGSEQRCDWIESGEINSLLADEPPINLETRRISAATGEGLESLKARIFAQLDVIRVYTKLPSSKTADFEKPFTIPRGGTLLDVAELIHQDLVKSLKHARVWGAHVHDGAIVKADYVLHDRDVVEIHS